MDERMGVFKYKRVQVRDRRKAELRVWREQ